MKKWGVLFIGLMAGSQLWAVEVPPLLEIQPQQYTSSFPVENNTLQPGKYTLSVTQISFPNKSVQVLDSSAKLLQYSPAVLNLAPGQKAAFHLKYLGPEDNEERYFDLSVLENAYPQESSASVSISFPLLAHSYLLIPPVQPLLSYHMDNEKVQNTGNAYFLLMKDEACGNQRGETLFIPPGKSVKLPALSGRSVLSIGQKQQIKVLINQCKK